MQWVRPASPAQPLLPTPPGKGDLQPQLDSALQDVNDMYLLLEETEKQAVRRALIEERGRFCTFITFLQPVVNGELTMLGEITHLQGIIDDLVVLTAEPHKLPPASEQVIKDLKGSDYSWSYQTPPSSPSSSSSRKSSMCSAPSSSSSAKGGGAPWPGGAQTYSPGSTCRYRSLAQPATATARLSSISSHDSGFISQDATYSKPPSPMPSDITSQVRWHLQNPFKVGYSGLRPVSGYPRGGPPTAVETSLEVPRATALRTSLNSLPHG
uniref:MTSS1-like protein isoform X10 n=1 Tax=Sus scrofa TaxID=9823 RepID=A0A480N4P0_PIG